MYHPEALEPIVAFLRSIGMEVEYGEGAHNGFLPGVNIHAGALHVDPDTLVGSGDVLHEAGHIIVVPRRYWSRLGTDLQAGVDDLLATEKMPDGSDDPLLVTASKQGEMMAQAWSFAVAEHLGIPKGCIFFPGAHKMHEYEGIHPMQAWLERGTHYGPLFLADAGFTGYSGIFGFGRDNGLAPFPHMSRWSLD